MKKKRFKWLNKNFKNFLYNFSSKNHKFKYREKIRICSLTNKKIFEIDLDDLKIFENELYLFTREEPINSLNCFEFIVNTLIISFLSVEFKKERVINTVQIAMISNENPTMFKNLNSDHIYKLVKVKILISSVSRNKVKIGHIDHRIINKKTKNTILVNSDSNNKLFDAPKNNENSIPQEKISRNRIDFVDCQIIKAQDSSGKKSISENKGYLLFFLERELVGKIFVGKTLEVTGIYLPNNFFINPKKKFSKNQYLSKQMIVYIIGFRNCSPFKNFNYLKKEILFDDDFLIFAKSSEIYDWIVSSIIPDYMGQDDAKAGVACLMFGGTTKLNYHQIHFDGQINVLLVGDNTNFKENLFNFIKKISSILSEEDLFGYNQSQSEKFSFGYFSNQMNIEFKKKKFSKTKKINCIKEIDKISSLNRIEIFKLMDNDTISLSEKKIQSFSKNISFLAGISENIFKECLINIQTQQGLDLKLISKFDLIFSINQKSNNKNEKKKAYDVLNFREKNNSVLGNLTLETISVEMLKKYIRFVHRNFNPILTKAAADLIKDVYLHMKTVFRKKTENLMKKQCKMSIQQLESIIKISESLSKMKMAKKVFIPEALEAVRLFKKRFFL